MPDRMTKPEYRQQWMKAQEEVADLIYRAMKVQQLLPSLYEGALAEKAPDFEPEWKWDRENTG